MTQIRFHKSIIIIVDPLETHWRLTCLIRVPSETNMPHWRPTCLIGDQLSSWETYKRPTCLVWSQLVFDMHHQRPMRDLHARSESDMPDQKHIKMLGQACPSLIRHVSLWLGMLVSNGSRIKLVSLHCWFSDGSATSVQ